MSAPEPAPRSRRRRAGSPSEARAHRRSGDWVKLARSGPVVRRATKVALVVGSVLLAINHGDTILAGDLTPTRWARMGLTVLVPYLVSTFSSVSALLDVDRRDSPPR